MADKPNTTADDIWKTLLAKRRAAVDAIENGTGRMDKHLAIIEACDETLLGRPARGLLDVLYKLTFLWDGCRRSDDPKDKQKARILEDLAYIMGPIEVPAE